MDAVVITQKPKEIDDLVFMEEIRNYPVIWNRFTSDFKNKYKKRNAYEAVAAVFSLSAEETERKYNNIRTVYGRYIKRQASGSGREDDINKDIYDKLEWLKPFIKSKGTVTNYQPAYSASTCTSSTIQTFEDFLDREIGNPLSSSPKDGHGLDNTTAYAVEEDDPTPTDLQDIPNPCFSITSTTIKCGKTKHREKK